MPLVNPPDVIEVQVTQEEIDKGVRHSPNACPIGLALGRDGWRDVAVFWGRHYIEAGRYRSSGADIFAETFDAGRPVSPCTIVFTRVEE